jgi:hypothetical protein
MLPGRRLRHDAVKEMEKLLAVAYSNALYRLDRFQPIAIPDLRAARNGAARDRTSEPAGSRPWHP